MEWISVVVMFAICIGSVFWSDLRRTSPSKRDDRQQRNSAEPPSRH